MFRVVRSGAPLMYLLLSACSVARPVPVALNASELKAFLADHPEGNLRVVEHSGRRYWIHKPSIEGDSLVGRRGYDLPIQPMSVRVDQLAELHTSQFSWERTGLFVGATAATVGLAWAILISQAEDAPH